MKLNAFTPENCITTRSHNGVPSISINLKAGLFRFNFQATELIGVKDADHVLFHQDEDEPENWYVEKVKENGFVIRSKEASGKGLVFNNAILAKEIAESVAFTGKSGKCFIAGTPTKFEKKVLFGVLTATLRNV